MRVECRESIKSAGYVLSEGDIVSVPDEVGARWCAAGWAVDTAGVIPTGERRVLNAQLSIEPAQHGHSAPNLEG
jgi:hypothetical protein